MRSAANVVLFQVSIYLEAPGVAQFRLAQGANTITHDVVGDTTLVFDVVP